MTSRGQVHVWGCKRSTCCRKDFACARLGGGGGGSGGADGKGGGACAPNACAASDTARAEPDRLAALAQ
eukprot:1482491-Pleurochrysis_carterae.AAC.2